MKMLLGIGKVSSLTLIKIVIMLAISVSVQTTPAQITNLGIAIAGGQSVLYWPTSSTNYVLQTTTNLNTPNWTDVSNAVPVVAVAVTNNAAMAFFRLVQITNPPSTTADGMALIPAGTFTMGDTLDGESDALPISVTISAFYMDTNL